MGKAQMLGATRMMALGLFLASCLLGARLSKELKRRAQRDKRLQSLAARVSKGLFPEADERHVLSEDPIFYIQTMDRLRDRIQYLLEGLITPTPWVVASRQFPSALFFLCYLMRPVQVAKIYGRHTLRRVYHGKTSR